MNEPSQANSSNAVPQEGPDKTARVAEGATTEAPPANNADASNQPPSGRSIPDDSVTVEYSIRICGGKEVIADVCSKFELPLALREELLARTDGAFPRLFDEIVVAPVVGAFHGFLIRRFDQTSKQRLKQVEQSSPDLGSNLGPKLPALQRIVAQTMSSPLMHPTPPPPRMPGFAATGDLANQV